MDKWFSERTHRHTASEGECFDCHDQLNSRLLWPVEATVDGEPRNVFMCLACVGLELLRMAAPSLEANADAVESHAAGCVARCERCLRRSRPTELHFGFNLCAECRSKSN